MRCGGRRTTVSLGIIRHYKVWVLENRIIILVRCPLKTLRLTDVIPGQNEGKEAGSWSVLGLRHAVLSYKIFDLLPYMLFVFSTAWLTGGHGES